MANALRWQAGLIFPATGAAAQDCGADAFQRAVCALPEARAEWAKMEAALAAVQGPARPAILETPARWRTMMGGWDPEVTRSELAGSDQSVALDYFEENHGWRPKDGTDAEVIQLIEERSAAFASMGRNWTGFEALKFALPGVGVTLSTGWDYTTADVMPSRHSNLICGGSVELRLGDRACSIMAYGYGDRINTVYSVDDLVEGGRVHRGNCDFNGLAPDCPDSETDDPEAHWDSEVSRDVELMREDLAQPNTGALAKNDPEFWGALNLYPEDWFQTCLMTKTTRPRA